MPTGLPTLRGFTLIELLVVLSIMALLLTLSVPRYFQSEDHSKEVVLRDNLRITRETIDMFYGDKGRYPNSLEELVDERYLRSLPWDPITQNNNSWLLDAPPEGTQGEVYNLHSSARGETRDGQPFGSL